MALPELTQADIEKFLDALPSMQLKEQEELLADIEKWQADNAVRAARRDFLAFCHRVYPGFKEGPHHRFLKPLLHEVQDGTQTRLTVSMPPRFGKSETIAYLFVAWYLGHNPSHHIMMVTHTADLSADFGRKVRNLIDSEIYRDVFPDTIVSKDKAAAGNWATTAGGKYLAIGIGASVAGHGAHLLVADDLCICDTTPVATAAGTKLAGQVQSGDYLWGQSGYQRVIRKTQSKHAQAVRVAGVIFSLEHPVWTFNRGWVRAGQLVSTDLLRTVSFCDLLLLSLRGLYAKRHGQSVGQVVPARVQHMGHDETKMSQPKSGQLRKLWRAGFSGLRALGSLCLLSARLRPRSLAEAYAGSNRQRQGIHSGKLSMGERRNAAEQQNQRRSFSTRGAGAVGAAACTTSGYAYASYGAPLKGHGAHPRASAGITEAELGAAPRTAAEFGWFRSTVARILGSHSKVRAGAGLEARPAVGVAAAQGRLADVCRRLQKIAVQCYEARHSAMGFLLGVRSCGAITIEDATTRRFVNFEVEGDNTFFAGTVLSHNCSEQAMLSNPDAAFATAWTYMQVGPLQRLMPGGRIVMIGTRWGKKDPIGCALQWAQDNKSSTPWMEVRFPAIMPSGKSLWAEQWSVEALLAKKAGMLPQYWAAQYMQEPTSEEGALIKREWWKMWLKEDPPEVEFVIQSWDTAHEAKNSADYSACTTWGVWTTSDGESRIILLDAIKGHWEFPELKLKVLEQWKAWSPEALIVEKKAAGAPLIQELRRMNIVVQETVPSRGSKAVSNDKRARVNAIAELFSSGMVYAPDKRWAHEVINEVAEFPHGQNDDYVDTVSQAMARYRNGGFIRTPTDYDDNVEEFRARQRAYYG